MWHVCASLADSTHFAWWQTTHHSRTSYHKLEGLSPGWVKERQRCMCGVFSSPPSFFLQWLGKDSQTRQSGTISNECLRVCNYARGFYRGKRQKFYPNIMCHKSPRMCKPSRLFFLICSRDPLGGATPHMSVYAESERESGENPRLKNTHHFLQCPLPFYI